MSVRRPGRDRRQSRRCPPTPGGRADDLRLSCGWSHVCRTRRTTGRGRMRPPRRGWRRCTDPELFAIAGEVPARRASRPCPRDLRAGLLAREPAPGPPRSPTRAAQSTDAQPGAAAGRRAAADAQARRGDTLGAIDVYRAASTISLPAISPRLPAPGGDHGSMRGLEQEIVEADTRGSPTPTWPRGRAPRPGSSPRISSMRSAGRRRHMLRAAGAVRSSARHRARRRRHHRRTS